MSLFSEAVFFRQETDVFAVWGEKKTVSKLVHLSKDWQFVPGWFLIFALTVDSFPVSRRLGIFEDVQKSQ